ncbi:hypothetical protein ACWDR5_20465 [Streptomyces koyangensis]
MSDEQWPLTEPLVTAWKQERVARSATGDPGFTLWRQDGLDQWIEEIRRCRVRERAR